ncbi:MAG: LCP family protein [Lachnospiraceae bacterium]|nr:LCP family protein [Lachnospiraceae bacterium]
MASKNSGKRGGRGGAKIVIFIVEILVIVGLVSALVYFFNNKYNNGDNAGGPSLAIVDNNDLTPADMGISDEVQELTQDGGAMSGYMNIALFGIDATSTGISALEKGSRSDTIIIASINKDTGDVKLCSVYRDTYLNTGSGGYQKCNAAYALGGGNVAISMLNSNLDLDISNWVSISYKGLADAIDCLGGVYIDVDSSEIDHLNNYQIGISEVLKCDYTPVTQTGYQLLNGIQASAYCRIRYTAGDDFKRAERQREVLQAAMDQAKKADADTIVRTFNTVSSSVLTSLDSDTFLELVKNIGRYNIVAENGFPEASLRTTGTIGAKGSCVIPVNLESNVIWLHQYLFGDENYTPSTTVKEYSSQIYSETSPYVSY